MSFSHAFFGNINNNALLAFEAQFGAFLSSQDNNNILFNPTASRSWAEHYMTQQNTPTDTILVRPSSYGIDYLAVTVKYSNKKDDYLHYLFRLAPKNGTIGFCSIDIVIERKIVAESGLTEDFLKKLKLLPQLARENNTASYSAEPDKKSGCILM